MDGVSACFYLEATLTRKRTQIQRRSLSLSRRVLKIFFNIPHFNPSVEEQQKPLIYHLPIYHLSIYPFTIYPFTIYHLPTWRQNSRSLHAEFSPNSAWALNPLPTSPPSREGSGVGLFFSDSGVFLLFRLKSQRDGWRLCVLLSGSNAYKEKNTETTSETKSQTEQKCFLGFLLFWQHFNPSAEKQQKP